MLCVTNTFKLVNVRLPLRTIVQCDVEKNNNKLYKRYMIKNFKLCRTAVQYFNPNNT